MELEKKGTAGGRSASERGGEPRSGTLSLPTLRMLPTPSSYKKKDRSQAVFFCGAGEERNCQWPFRQRARRGAEERNALTSDTSHASDSLQLQKKKTTLRRSFFVELEGVEPSIPYATDNLICLQSLFPDRSQILISCSPFIY